jgi:hypothetical protein
LPRAPHSATGRIDVRARLAAHRSDNGDGAAFAIETGSDIAIGASQAQLAKYDTLPASTTCWVATPENGACHSDRRAVSLEHEDPLGSELPVRVEYIGGTKTDPISNCVR